MPVCLCVCRPRSAGYPRYVQRDNVGVSVLVAFLVAPARVLLPLVDIGQLLEKEDPLACFVVSLFCCFVVLLRSWSCGGQTGRTGVRIISLLIFGDWAYSVTAFAGHIDCRERTTDIVKGGCCACAVHPEQPKNPQKREKVARILNPFPSGHQLHIRLKAPISMQRARRYKKDSRHT